MRRVWIVAATEAGARVRSKAFLVSVVLMPVLFVAMGALQRMLAGAADTRPRRFAIVDRSGAGLADALEAAAVRRNGSTGPDGRPLVVFEPVVEAGAASPEARLALSERVRSGALFAFVEIEPGAVDAVDAAIRYHSDAPTYRDLRDWIQATLGAEIRARRWRAAGIDPALVARLERPVAVTDLGLLARLPDGRIAPAEKVDPVRAWLMPFSIMMLLFGLTMMSAPQLMQAVIEEKMSRVSEVLLGSVPPFELMMGKLVGGAAVSLLLAGIYSSGGIAAAAQLGHADLVTPALAMWFVVFLLLAVFVYGALYLAVGAACNEIKDAQNLVVPVMLLSFFPIVMMRAVMEAPGSPLAVGASLFPPATPFLMILRLALHPSPPLWQVLLSIALTASAATGCVWAAGRIFRVGLLAHGKTPGLGELLRWVRSG